MRTSIPVPFPQNDTVGIVVTDQLDMFDGSSKDRQLIPIGKLTGRPYDALLLEPEYAQYLLRSKYGELERHEPALFQFLVSRFGMPARTPAHNRLQNRFLDPSFVLRMAIAASKDVREMIDNCRALDVPSIWRRHVASTYRSLTATRQAELRSIGTRYIAKDAERLHEVLVAQIDHIRVRRGEDEVAGSELIDPLFAVVHEFEADGPDVSYSIYSSGEVLTIRRDEYGKEEEAVIGRAFVSHGRMRFPVEVKPIVGDDYPSVLRQMKKARSNQLLIGEFRSTSASWDELVKVFGMSGISVVHLETVERTEIPLHCVSLPVVHLSNDEAMRIADEEFGKAKHEMEATSAKR